MPVFFFGSGRGSRGQRSLSTWLFCSGLFLTRERVHIVQWNVGDNWVNLLCSKRDSSPDLCRPNVWDYCGVFLITPCFCSNIQSYCLVWFWCHCKNSLNLAIPWQGIVKESKYLVPCTRYLENKLEQQRPPIVQCKPNWVLNAWNHPLRRNEEWVLSGIQTLAAPIRAFELMLSCVSCVFITRCLIARKKQYSPMRL